MTEAADWRQKPCGCWERLIVSGSVFDPPGRTIWIDDPISRCQAHTSAQAAAPPPEVLPRPCPSCGCGSPAHTADCEQADAA